MKAHACLSKDKLGDIVPFLEDVLSTGFPSGWTHLFEKLHSFFTERFESEWEKKRPPSLLVFCLKPGT